MVFNLCKAAFLYTVVAMCYIHASGHAIERGRKLLKGGGGLGLSAGGVASTTVSCTTTPAAYIASNPDLSIFNSALESVGLSTSLNSYYSAYTIFAPTNAAFTRLLSQEDTTLEALQTTNQGTLDLILKNHIIPGDALTVSDFSVGSTYATMNQGENIQLASSLNPIIVQADIETCASVIHIVDIVLVPDFVSIPAAAAASGSTTPGSSGTGSTAATGGSSLDVTNVNVNGNAGGGSFTSASGSFGGGAFDFSAINIAG
eukprot:CAMPEP_0118798240 /NCGR_PEP_ID=MMETSP1161-20130426/661_1 /TAXON_ID=249345 /ORGANISM="Picochlorum oklahomensis, Strain CCMP2329" /LENGTH=258 /DNA_ID=CAMNT_0006725605 /DNA_START=19 /DNA_END=795 /DNA_ORIENTATION=-